MCPLYSCIAIVVVLVGIFFAATGRGGELAYEHADHAPLDLGPVSAADVALLRPPTAMWGYNMQVTDEALDQIARAMRERDVKIAYLQRAARRARPTPKRGASPQAPRAPTIGVGRDPVTRRRRSPRISRTAGPVPASDHAADQK